MKLTTKFPASSQVSIHVAPSLYGPLVLAADEALLTDDGQQSFNTLALAKPEAANFTVTPESAPLDRRTWADKEFEFRLPTPSNVVSVRVIGRPRETIRRRRLLLAANWNY